MTIPVNESAASKIVRTTADVGLANRWYHLLARLGYRRMDHALRPGDLRNGSFIRGWATDLGSSWAKPGRA